MDELHIDDAIDHLARHLAQKFAPDAGPVVAVSIQCAQQYDLEVKFVAEAFWMSRGVNIVNQTMREGEPYHRPFLDAAWHLCRIGVLRPGQKGPGVGVIGHSPDDGYSITSFGKEWVAVAAQRPPTDPGRFLQVVQPFADRFGNGFLQRASEASACYRTANYLACCALAGAAAESILLALAIAKSGGNEAQVLSTYRSGSGRRKITDQILRNVPKGVAEQVRVASNILHFWRDETTHGTPTTISEVEAYGSLGQLLRFGQLAVDNWATLVS